MRFNPLPWASFSVDSQVPAFDKGFTEVNTNVSVQPVANLQVSVGHRYLNGNQEQYEGTTGVFEQQRYSVYRDLTNWVASFGAVVRDNSGVKEYGVLLTFTLKAFPKFGFDLNFDPGSEGQ